MIPTVGKRASRNLSLGLSVSVSDFVSACSLFELAPFNNLVCVSPSVSLSEF